MKTSSISDNYHKLQELENAAVDAAICANWASAIEINKQILDQQKDNVQATLRLGFAYLQNQKLNQALEQYKRVLSIQPQNMIAAEYAEKIKLQKTDHKKTTDVKLVLDPQTFVELPGKTKSVSLSQLGQKNVLASLIVGEQVYLSIRKRHVEIRTQSGDYAGILPDDVGTRLMYFLENDSVYHVFIREANLNSLTVFVREVSKGKKVEKMASFPVDIPGSLSKVIAQQHQDEIDGKKGTIQDPEKSDPLVTDAAGLDDEDDEDDGIGDDLLKDVGDEDKNEASLLGIETDEDEDEEE